MTVIDPAAIRDNNLFNRPRVHGNGFLQLDLTPSRRLHIWNHPDIPRQTNPTPIHDHRFSFTSRILLGSMVNRKIRRVNLRLDEATQAQGLAHRVYRARVRQGEDTYLAPTDEIALLQEESKKQYGAGESYSMEIGEIHESLPDGLTVTIIEKAGRTLAQGGPSPNVYVPLNVKPDNDFNRYSLKPEALWWIISDALMSARIVHPRDLTRPCPACGRTEIACQC